MLSDLNGIHIESSVFPQLTTRQTNQQMADMTNL